MNAKEIIIDWLKEHNCDGLCDLDNDTCGCGIDDLEPGYHCIHLDHCVAARKCEPTEEQKADGCTVAYAPVYF